MNLEDASSTVGRAFFGKSRGLAAIEVSRPLAIDGLWYFFECVNAPCPDLHGGTALPDLQYDSKDVLVALRTSELKRFPLWGKPGLCVRGSTGCMTCFMDATHGMVGCVVISRCPIPAAADAVLSG